MQYLLESLITFDRSLFCTFYAVCVAKGHMSTSTLIKIVYSVSSAVLLVQVGCIPYQPLASYTNPSGRLSAVSHLDDQFSGFILGCYCRRLVAIKVYAAGLD